MSVSMISTGFQSSRRHEIFLESNHSSGLVRSIKPVLTVNGIEQPLPAEFVTQENQALDIQLSNPSPETEFAGDRNRLAITCFLQHTSRGDSSGAVIPSLDPLETSGALTRPEPWCGFEDRWFLFSVPENSNLEVRATSQKESPRIEFHDDQSEA